MAGDLLSDRLGLESSSFRMSDVMSNPRNGFCSGSLVGDEANLLSSPFVSVGQLSGVGGGLDWAGLILSSENNHLIRRLVRTKINGQFRDWKII